MHYQGILIGAATFLLIGSFHVVVIRCEYYFGKGIWPLFAVVGAGALIGSLFIAHTVLSIFWLRSTDACTFLTPCFP